MNYMKSILHPTSGRFLEVYSNHPGLQIYTGNELPHQHVYPPDLEDHDWRGCKNMRINSLKLVNCIIVILFSQQYNFKINFEIK